MRSTTSGLARSGWRSRTVAALSLALALTSLAGCASAVPPASSSSSAHSTIPKSAYSDRTGITSSSVTIGNVSTLTPSGLFEGAEVGTEAYADLVNSTGGVNGRRIIVDGGDDASSGPSNKQLTQAAIAKVFAMVGSISLQDGYGATVLAANPQVPNVSVALDTATNDLPSTFSPEPASGGWQLGPLVYFTSKYPAEIQHAGALIADQASAVTPWDAEKAAMEHLGYKVVYDPRFATSTEDFTPYVIGMRNAGVKILFIEQMQEADAASVFTALGRQDFHPVVVLGASTYSQSLVSASGGAPVIDGSYLEQNLSLYLGEDEAGIPAIGRFLSWVQKVSPGFSPDLSTLDGWISAELFVRALRQAGTNPSRGSVLQALGSVRKFTADNLIAPTDPAAKTPASCYLIAQIENGTFTRVGDPPVSSSTNGYRCDQAYFLPPGTGS